MAIGIVRAIEEMSRIIDNINGEWMPLEDDPSMSAMITEKKGELMIHFRSDNGLYRRGFIFSSQYEIDYEKEGLVK